ncbi:MAG: hypothetical protein ABWZ66_03935 [Pyrinomonadaceae bacterium]
MAYVLAPAANVMAIAEREFGAAAEIRFTGFSSCIGVIARQGNNVTGVHLSMMAPDETWFNVQAAADTVAALGGYHQVVVIGQLQMWEDTQPVTEGYQSLIDQLTAPIFSEQDDGNYGGRVNNGTFQIYVNGAYIDVS